MTERADITELLHRWREGSRDAENELFLAVMPKLRSLARYLMRRERKGHSLQATELIDEVYFRMVAARERDWRNRGHFFAIAARAMRRYLIDHARGRHATGFVPLDEIEGLLPAAGEKMDQAILVDQFLEEMAKTNPDWCYIVEVKYFLGLTDEEAADALGLKLRTFQRAWRDARRWLFTRMEKAAAKSTAARTPSARA